MTVHRLLLVFSGVFALTFVTVAADSPSPKLVLEAGTDKLDAVANSGHGRMKWSHGAFLHMDTIGALPPIFSTLDREGRFISSTKVSLTDAAEFWVFDFDRKADNSIVFSGMTHSSYEEDFPFIAWVSPNGHTERVTRTTPYYPYKLTIAPDGTVWTMGLEMINRDPKDPGLDPEAGVLRQFDRGGKLMASVWPQSSFSTGRERARLSDGRLVATGDRLGWYSSIGGSSKYVEVSTNTMERHAYPGLPRDPLLERWDGSVDGLALTDGGDAVVSIEYHRSPCRTAYKLDRAKSQWQALPVPTLGGYQFAPSLMGSDGGNLVFQYAYSAAFFSLPR
jgi:hypothetical protein